MFQARQFIIPTSSVLLSSIGFIRYDKKQYYTEEEVYAIIREYNELLVTILLNGEDNIEFYYEFGKIVEENGNPHERIYYEIDDFVNQVFENAFIDKEDITINDINIENE
jgi:hypothetical protein